MIDGKQMNGSLIFSGLAVGTYILTEVATPAEYDTKENIGLTWTSNI